MTALSSSSSLQSRKGFRWKLLPVSEAITGAEFSATSLAWMHLPDGSLQRFIFQDCACYKRGRVAVI